MSVFELDTDGEYQVLPIDSLPITVKPFLYLVASTVSTEGYKLVSYFLLYGGETVTSLWLRLQNRRPSWKIQGLVLHGKILYRSRDCSHPVVW